MKAFLHSLICATSLICGEAHAGTMPLKLTLMSFTTSRSTAGRTRAWSWRDLRLSARC